MVLISFVFNSWLKSTIFNYGKKVTHSEYGIWNAFLILTWWWNQLTWPWKVGRYLSLLVEPFRQKLPNPQDFSLLFYLPFHAFFFSYRTLSCPDVLSRTGLYRKRKYSYQPRSRYYGVCKDFWNSLCANPLWFKNVVSNRCSIVVRVSVIIW